MLKYILYKRVEIGNDLAGNNWDYILELVFQLSLNSSFDVLVETENDLKEIWKERSGLELLMMVKY